MFSIPEQFLAAIKANFDAQLATSTALTRKVFESVEKLVDLNMNAAKMAMSESTNAAKELLSAKEPQEFFSLSTTQAQQHIEKTFVYGRHVTTIVSNTRADFTTAAEAQVAETSRKVAALVDVAAKNAPAGSEHTIALVKSAIGNANAGYEQWTKTTHQALDVLEGHLTTAANQFSQAVEKTANRAAKK